jgi:hypothetical protein
MCLATLFALGGAVAIDASCSVSSPRHAQRFSCNSLIRLPVSSDARQMRRADALTKGILFL